MGSVLDRIIDAKRAEVARRKTEVPIEELQSRVLTVDRPRNFYSAVTKQPNRKINLIAELKKASPSAGLIRPDFDVPTLAKVYADAGVDAISVLTDETFFQGKLEYIHQAKMASPLPVLRKDFIIDEYQIYESRAAGADAILLITEVLDADEMLDLLMLASTLKMTTLIEVHTEASLKMVRERVGFPHERYSLLGINNRDLHVQKTDINNTLNLVKLLDEEAMEAVVSESGIRTAADIDRLAEAGVRAVLIGESIMKEADIAGKIAELLGPKAVAQ